MIGHKEPTVAAFFMAPPFRVYFIMLNTNKCSLQCTEQDCGSAFQ